LIVKSADWPRWSLRFRVGLQLGAFGERVVSRLFLFADRKQRVEIIFQFKLLGPAGQCAIDSDLVMRRAATIPSLRGRALRLMMVFGGGSSPMSFAG